MGTKQHITQHVRGGMELQNERGEVSLSFSPVQKQMSKLPYRDVLHVTIQHVLLHVKLDHGMRRRG